MKIKLSKYDTARLLWKDSPCTLRNTLQNPSIDNAPRFQYGSIYFKDEVNKPKKVFTEFQKPELLLHNFRRQLKQVDIQAKKLMVNHKMSSTSRDMAVTKRSTSVTDTKFYQRPQLLELRHDRFGNRSSYYGNYDVKDLENKVRESRRNFYSSNRIDLSKPDNFYPGPGTYFPQKFQESRILRNIFSQKIRSSSVKV